VLLKGLLETQILNSHQLTLGMQRCVEGLADLRCVYVYVCVCARV
jgi:hypothetical protein